MISLIEYINNFLLYFVQTLYYIHFIKVIKNTISKIKVLSRRYALLGYRSCNVVITIYINNFIYPLTLNSWSTIHFECDE